MSEKLSGNTAAAEVKSPSSLSDSEKGGFFPWLEGDDVRPNMSPKKLSRFPVMGAVGLIGSALTVLLSWLTLHFFKGHTVIDGGRLPKPAAWLSVILSLNSILVHIAVSQGMAVTWWFRASKKQTTVADLHNIWATGSSVVSAVLSWKTFNYIALATIFTATLPINGILLQNAVTSGVNLHNNSAPTTDFSIATSVSAGFSADLNSDGTVSTFTDQWKQMIPKVIANFDGMVKSTNSMTTCKGTCFANVTGLGFESDCTHVDEPYSLPLDNSTSNSSDLTTIFSVDLSWDVTQPTEIVLNTLYKPNAACSGTLKSTTCTLRMGTVTVPVQVVYDLKGNTDFSWYLQPSLSTPSSPELIYYKDINFMQLPVVTESNTNRTAFGGIATALSNYFQSSITMGSSENGSISVNSNGLYARQIEPQLSTQATQTDINGNPVHWNKCNISFSGFESMSTPQDDLFTQIRASLFYTSVLIADQLPSEDNSFVQAVPNVDDTSNRSEYHILWRFWGASVAVTFSIILFILPTFYGFWTLARKTTLSPFETARAFHAPVLMNAPTNLDTPGLLKEVGNKNLHTDLVVASTMRDEGKM